MDNSSDKKITIARTLNNIAHNCLKTETIDDEDEDKYERKIRVKQNKRKNNLLVDLGRKNINSLNTQDRIQKGIKIKSQEKANSKVLLEYELQEQKNIHENTMESVNRSVKTRIEQLISELPSKEERKIEKDLLQEIEELNKEIRELNSDNLNELNKKFNENIEKDISKGKSLSAHVNMFKRIYNSFVDDLKPFYNRLDQISNDKTQTTEQQKLNEEFLKKLDSLLQQKCNEENREEHQQVDSKIISIVNPDVKVVEENKKYELKRSIGLQVNHEIENNGKIKEKESQQNDLKETQEEINRDERIRNQFEEIDSKEKYQHYDLVIQYNHEMSEELNGHAHSVAGKRLLIEYYEDAIKKLLYKSDNEALKKKFCNTEVEVIDQNQKEENKNIQLQFEFFKNVQVEEELQKKNEKQLQIYTKEEINKDLKVKTKENKTEVQEYSVVEKEKFEEEISEDQYMLRCLQLFHQKLPDISILHNAQQNDDEFPDI